MNAPMPVVRQVLPHGSWDAEPADTITLDFDQRYRRRVTLTTDSGRSFLLDLAETRLLADGDGLDLGGALGIVRVVAAPEDLAEIRPAGDLTLAALAWHLGNRHMPAEIADEAVRIRRDPVIEAFAVRIGGEVSAIRAPFNPLSAAHSHH